MWVTVDFDTRGEQVVTVGGWDSMTQHRIVLDEVEGELVARLAVDQRTQIWLSSGPSSGLL